MTEWLVVLGALGGIAAKWMVLSEKRSQIARKHEAWDDTGPGYDWYDGSSTVPVLKARDRVAEAGHRLVINEQEEAEAKTEANDHGL